MATPQAIPRLDFDAFLAWEAGQAEKHEFVQGEIFAMAGARRVHVTVAGNIFAAFKSHLRGGACRAYMADMLLRVEAADVGFYPDVMVTCDRRDHGADRAMRHALLVVEVLSETTAAYDRGDKFAHYRKLDSLREYVLVDIAARRVECFRRDAENHWVLHDFTGDGETCEFASLDLKLPLAAVFEDVEAPDGDLEPPA